MPTSRQNIYFFDSLAKSDPFLGIVYKVHEQVTSRQEWYFNLTNYNSGVFSIDIVEPCR